MDNGLNIYQDLKSRRLQKKLDPHVKEAMGLKSVYIRKTNDPYLVEEYLLKVVISEKGAIRDHLYLTSVIHSE